MPTSSMFHHLHTITRKHTWPLPQHELKDPITAAIHSASHKLLGMTASSSDCWPVRWSFKSLTAAWGYTSWLLQWLPSTNSAGSDYRERHLSNRCLFIYTQDSFHWTLGYEAVLTVLSWLEINQYAIQNIPSVCQLSIQFWHCLHPIWQAIVMPSLLCWNQLYAFTAIGNMYLYLCSPIQVCHFVSFCVCP
jgi:hypothetical protein